MKMGPLSKLHPLVWFILLALVLRLVALGRESLWYDEALSYHAAALPVSALFDNTAESSHPPLYYALLHIWRGVVPRTDGALRLLGALLNVALVPALYALARQWNRSHREALAAAFMVVVSPFQILYSHELRMYTLLMLLVTLTVWAYGRARPQTGYGWWVLFCLLGAAAMYTHLFAAMTLLAIGLYALVHQQARAALWRTIGAGFGIILLYIPWLLVLFRGQTQAVGGLRPLLQSFTYNPILPLTAPTFLLFGLSRTLIYSGLALFLTLALLVVLLLEGRKAWRQGSGSGLLLPALIVFLTMGIPLAVYLVRPFFLPERTLAAAAPFLLLLLAWGLSRWGSPLPYLVGGAAALMVVGTLIYLLGPAQKPPYREVMAYVTAHSQPDDVILHTSDGSYLPALYYTEWPDHGLLAGDPDPRKAAAVYEAFGGKVWPREAITAGERLWLIVALEHSEEWQITQADYFAQNYPLLERQNIGGIEIYLYDLPFRMP
ncbi:MAG: glycosyltransferase family 39 protein [Candidatus Promineifilaceae bacterium]